MAYNVPSYESGRFSFGPGILYIGAVGTTPTIDIGAVKGDSELIIDRESLEMQQGSPQSVVKQYAIKETVGFKVSSVEWDLDNLSHALGAGVTSINGAEEILEFGGDMDYANVALRFVHRTPDGGTVDMHLFKAEGSGKLSIALKETDFHEFPFEFNILEGSLNFEGSALADKKKKFKIIRTKV